MNKKLYIIAGAPNMRKSSVIRALTGVRDTRTFTLQFEIDRVNTHVMVTSPNEISSNVFPNGIGIQSLIELLSNLNETAIILPLRSISPRFNLPVASDYIQALLNAGFEIAPVIMFNEPIALPNGIEGEVLVSNENIPSNLTASKVRKIWEII